ncbi:hypothetical protein JHK82_057146 [Glycine max]|uniref:Uncharacterized protein n=1 Tax=Glycine max TaxID=3847 RepID=K7N503_SOYBN|nr:hypothetical protein JHK85_057998 [Glycine max]KAG5075803.1 hypothetical protein JHK84_057034 [Glycine max]KAG5078451.1 hypothetical protein JHK82_057146 [Glycine max]
MCHVRYSLYQQYHNAKVRQGIFYCVKARRHGFFRDYGLCDMTMLRFEPDKQVGFREYMRSDGTRSYFFCLDTVRSLFLGAGFTEVRNFLF